MKISLRTALSNVLLVSLLLLGWPLVGSCADTVVPHWIWSSANAKDNEEVPMRKTFTLAALPKTALLSVACDNHATAWVNGVEVLKNDEWSQPTTVDIAKHLKVGSNLLAVLGRNDTGSAALIVRLRLRDGDGHITDLVSDASWHQGDKVDGWQTVAYNDAAWSPVFDMGAVGRDPWGNVFNNNGSSPTGSNGEVAASSLVLAPGFAAELVYAVPRNTQGSWVSMVSDAKGRLITSDQNGGIFRFTPIAPGGDPATTEVERIDLPIGQAHGLLCAFDSLYVMVNGNQSPAHRSGLYRLQSTKGDDKYDKITKLRDFEGEGEHGPHNLALGPDNMIYFAIGNHTRPMTNVDVSLPPPVFGDDFALPRHWDPNGHARGIMAPGGYIGRTDAAGKQWDLVSMGYRNIFDIAFDPNGELFTWDADMEWDMGVPWYRPIRVIHTPPGSDFGWRSGSGKYPVWYADSLPPLMDVGPGSPTGMIFGYGAKFPAEYQRALFILDWTFGTVYAVHMQPDGATFKATKEEFVSGRPFPLTAVTITPDGSMYLCVGGRGTPSAIYRISYTGNESTAAVTVIPPTPQALQRRELETMLVGQHPDAVAKAWPYFGSTDRFLRYAARAVVEHQPVAEWQDKALAETNPQALITALIALARCGDKSLKDKAFASFLRIDVAALDADTKLEAIRACELLMIRLGQPDKTTCQRILTKYDPLFPSTDYRLNRDLSALLADLGSPSLIGRILEQMSFEEPPIVLSADLEQLIARNGGYAGPISQMLRTKPQQMHIYYALVLSTIKDGWTPAQRLSYFSWFDSALNESSGGNSFLGYIRDIQKDALNNVPEKERQSLLEACKDPNRKVKASAPLPVPKGPGKEWKTEELALLAQTNMRHRSFEDGKNMFAACQCTICHRFAGKGGSVGPDLSSVATRFGAPYIIESIVEPSKVISDQYQTTMFLTKDGNMVSGRLISEDGQDYMLAINPLDPSHLTSIAKSNVQKKAYTNISIMPPGLLNRLNQDEVLDMVAYLLSSGNPQDKFFK